MSPGPGRGYAKSEAAAAPGDPGADVQEPVAEFLGFGGREFAGQQEDAGPGVFVLGRRPDAVIVAGADVRNPAPVPSALAGTLQW